MIEASALLSLVIYIIVLGLVVWLILYIINMIPLPEPFGRIARIVLIVLAVLILINLLLGLVGSPIVRFR
jgi:hypothetical protein